MSIREAFQDKPIVAVVVVLVLIGAAVVIAGRGSGDVPPPPVASGLYFFDLDTGETFTAPVDAVPPIDAPSGAARGVLAHVFACGDCATAAHAVLYIETVDGDPALQTSRRVALPPKPGEKPNWLQATSPQSAPVTSQFLTHCGGARAERCNP